MVSERAIDQYLKHYAAPESRSIPEFTQLYQRVLVIPSYQEDFIRLKRVWSSLQGFLVILIINAPEADDPCSQGLFSQLFQQQRLSQSDLLCLLDIEGQHILLVDRLHHPIATQEGVGRARKIGADIALMLIQQGIIREPWIYNTDADATLPKTYGELALKGNHYAALIYPFYHVPLTTTQTACERYELSLLYYVAGLKFAQSPYAFPSLGSTIAVNATDYAKVRGFPPRPAGEDFYLLNKLAKVGTVALLPGPYITLSGRISHRVPWGTGPGIEKIAKLTIPDIEHLFYNPLCFLSLKAFLSKLNSSHTSSSIKAHFTRPEHLAFIEANDMLQQLTQQQSQRRSVYLKSIHDWFDGLRTLQFIHFMRNRYYPSVALMKLCHDWFLTKPSGAREHQKNLVAIQITQKFLFTKLPTTSQNTLQN